MSSRTFTDIDKDNPVFWALFERFTFEMIRRGLSHYSADAVMHRVRWETDSGIEDASNFKVNNNWSSFYARKFQTLHPGHADFFRKRVSKADNLNWGVLMGTKPPKDPKKLLEKVAKYLEGSSVDPLLAAAAIRRVIGLMP